MLFLKILLKFICLHVISFLNQLLRFGNSTKTDIVIQNDISVFWSFLNRILTPVSKKLINEFLPVKTLRNNIDSFSQTLKIGTTAQSNRYLLRLLSLNLKTNIGKDSEDLILKKFNLNESLIDRSGLMRQSSFESNIQLNPNSVYASLENVSVTNSTNRVFGPHKIGYIPFIDNTFLHQNSSSVNYLTKDSATGINFNALEDLYNYLIRFGDKTRLKKYPADSAYRTTRKIRKKNRVPKNFRGGRVAKKQLLPHSTVPKEILKQNVNTLKQIEYILKNREFFEDKVRRGLGKSNFPHFSEEIKRVMFSNYTPVGAYGTDSVVYSGDLASKNRVMVGRRINLTQRRGFIGSLDLLNQNVGFFNFDTNEEMDNSSEERNNENVGDLFFINPFVVFGFLFYSIIELTVLFYLMSFFFSNPYDTFKFFLKYPSVYFYEHLTGFPSPNYFFFAFSFWIITIIIFCVHILELVDEDEFNPPAFSWAYNFVSDVAYNFLIIGCLLFCVFEIFNFVDLMFSRIFFIGVPGYPNPFSIFFLLFYDIFYLLGTSNYFSFYAESFLQLETKFPVLYFSEYIPRVERYPLVQPYFLGNPYLDRPNFFLWLADNFLSFLSEGNRKKRFFVSTAESRFIFHRELIQDVRKYNFVRKNLHEIRFVGQLHTRGWNGFNYRLDLQTCVDPIMPSEQVMRFEWRLKNSHSHGLHSRLFKGFPFGANASANTATKKVAMTKGPRISSRYGYLQYLTRLDHIKKRGGDGGGWYHSAPRSLRKRLWLAKLSPGDRKTVLPKRRFKSFLFSPGRAKFSLMLNEPRRIRTKSERNFKHSRIFRNFWSYIPGNDKPRRYFRRKPFVSMLDFSNVISPNYAQSRISLDKSVIGRNRFKFPKIGKYGLRNLYLLKPDLLFSTEYVNHKLPLFTLKSQTNYEDLHNVRKMALVSSRPSRSFSSAVASDFFADNSVSRKLNVENKELATANLLRSKQGSLRLRRRVPRLIKERRIAISKIPNFPFKHSIKHKFVARIFANFEPKYFLKHTASFTTFSKFDEFVFQRHSAVDLFGNSYVLNMNSGVSYPFGLLFLGFNKFLNIQSPLKLISFDYYYSQNHNFFFSLFDNYLKRGQLRTMPTNSARFNHPLKGGLRYGWDFLYPMISELRLSEKILPLDFLYKGQLQFNYRHLRLDPYESIRNSTFTKGPCYFLDTRIQNWLNFVNVIWNDYYHFFFNRTHNTEGNGAKFVLASYNPVRGPASYKLFIASPTLEVPRVGQFFFNYIPWLQYKFKWLLYPTSTYKRFDSFRFIHQHANKKFYFTSLLKFYQMNLFRWQQTAQIFQWNQVQARNFLLHLFFHKYTLLAELINLRASFVNPNQQNNQLLLWTHFQKDQKMVEIAPAIEQFNSFFFGSRITDLTSQSVNLQSSSSVSELFIPAFTLTDFRFFQYVVDLRRWKALQTSYIRDWKFERYIRYLGPLLYQDNVASLMGFFAPFEYRNQIFVSRTRADALRFSVFFPKKVIDEKFASPLKRLNVPIWVPRSHKERLKSSGGSFYAFLLNRPFLTYGPNYSIFASKGKRILSGLYPHFRRLNLDSGLNFLYGYGLNGKIFDQFKSTFGDVLHGEEMFTELNSKKKRLLYDKAFWLSKSYELQNITQRLADKISQPEGIFDSKSLNQAILSQLGKPLDLSIPKVITRVDFMNKFKLQLGDSTKITSNSELKNMAQKLSKRNIFAQRIHPDIFIRAGGPKISSKQWQMGQSWLKFIVASQNVSVAPISSDSELLKNFVEGRVSSTLNDIVSPIWPTDRTGFRGLPQQSRFIMSFETRPKHGYFNFGLSGIGRLPRLSRSFFHMLFFRNKLEDFRDFKTHFLKLYLMSVPLFHYSDFSTNISFKLFWSFILGYHNSVLNVLSLRYLFIFNTALKQYQINPNLTKLMYFSDLGTLVPLHSSEEIRLSNILVLSDQYVKFKAYKKYQFFVSSMVSKSLNQVSPLSQISRLAKADANVADLPLPVVAHLVEALTKLPQYYVQKTVNFFQNSLIKLSFDFVNYICIRSFMLRNIDSNAIMFFNMSDRQFKRSNMLTKTVTTHLSPIVLIDNTDSNYISKEVFSHDFFRERFYFGSFRSNLHWYFYPVYSFFFIQDYLSTTIVDYVYHSFKLGLQLNFKYGQSVLISEKNMSDKKQMYLFWPHFWTFEPLVRVYPQSDFVQAFHHLSARLSSSNQLEGPIVQMLFRINEPLVLRTLFRFQSPDLEAAKLSNAFTTFFFSTDFLWFFQKLNTQLILPVRNCKFQTTFQLNFTEEFDLFSDKIFKNVTSIDGSGRHNRPQSVAQTLDAIFSYREYEKYRKEHHRQRFRSISPYWLQNSFRNRAHYSYGYRSPENRRRRQTHAALVMMLKRVARLDRYKLHPSHTRRISFFGNLNPELMIKNLLNTEKGSLKNSLSTVNISNNGNINFVDVATDDSKLLNLQKQRFFRTARSFEATQYASLESIRNMRRQRSRLIKKQIFERQLSLLPDRRLSLGAVPSYEHRSYRTPSRLLSQPAFSEYGILLAMEANSKDPSEIQENGDSMQSVSGNKQTNKIQNSTLQGSSLISKWLYQKQDQFYHHPQFKRTIQQELDALKLINYPVGFYSDGGNFINVKKPPARNDMFQTPGFKNPSFFESADNLDLFYELMLEVQRKAKDKTHSLNSSKEFLDERRKSLSPRADGGSAAVRQRSGVDAFHEVSPRYLRVPKPRKKTAGLSYDVIGGIPSTARRNKTNYPGIMVRRTTQRGVPHGLASGAKHYPVNVKRFVRSKSRVLMYIPYLYSKWFTQNPRLSSAVKLELLNIFINNQFDEFNYICVQALTLLKRKIMFNIVNLKLISYKQKILYFSPLSSKLNMQTSFFTLNWINYLLSKLVKYLFKLYVLSISQFHLYLLFDYLYMIRGLLISSFFQPDLRYIRLLYNPVVSRFKHDSTVSSDMLYFEDFYYKQTAKRILSQIAFTSHSVGGWHNPLGLAGQYVPGLNFYVKGTSSFNFNYQQSDFYSNRYFSPEILMDNNLKRQSSLLFDRNFFFNEFFISPNYKRAWHFLAFRIAGPISPFIEYDRLHNFPVNVPSSIVKHMHHRLPLMSFRRISDIAPNHMKGFFSTLMTDSSVLVGHDVTLPLKLKLLNFNLRFVSSYQRLMQQFFKTNASQIRGRVALFEQALKSRQLSILTEFHNRVNLESLVNKRRLGLRKNVWSPFRYNIYYRFNWRTYLHRFSSADLVGFRHYKLDPFSDVHHGKSVSSLKSRALQHLIISQIPRFELDARRRVPLTVSPKEFNLLFFLYFKYVNENFRDSGYNKLDSKIFKYVNRKVHPFLTTFLVERNPYFRPFWPQYLHKLKFKENLNEKSFDFKFKPRILHNSKKIPNYTTSGKLADLTILQSHKTRKNSLAHGPFGLLNRKKNRGVSLFKRFYKKGMDFLSREFTYFYYQIVGPTFLGLMHNHSFNAVLNQKLRYPISSNVQQFARTMEMSTRIAGFEHLWLHDVFYKVIPAIYHFIDRYILFNPKPYLNIWYKWFQPFTVRPSRFLFLIDYWSRSWGAISQGRRSKHSLPSPVQRYMQYGFFHEWWLPKVSVSRIFGIHKLFLTQRHRERQLNPAAWLSFDLFSRVRPAFRPFLIKFSKHFMFSKLIPSRGIPSYNAFVKSHTKFDNYFERHPYIAFSLGLRSMNNLIAAEGTYKEIKTRSQMLDFARRHYRNASPVNFKTPKHSFYDYSLFRKNRYIVKRKARVKRSIRTYQEVNKLFPFFSRYANQFFNSHVRRAELTPPTGARFGDWSAAETFLDTYDLHYSLRSWRQQLKNLPMHYTYSRGFLQNANFFAVMARPRRSVKLLNMLISRPYLTATRFIRSDDYPNWLSSVFLSKLFLGYGSLNLNNFDRLNMYYQPNLKIFFDFNAYKQRYNLGLLFRDLSFERDFQFFLLRKTRLFDIHGGPDSFSFFNYNYDIDLLTDFTNLSATDYFEFFVPKDLNLKGYLVKSRLSDLYFALERVFLKLNPFYVLLVLVDCYLMFLFGLFSLVTFFHKFDFTVFLNLFEINDGVIYYVKKRPIFQVLFHLAIFEEYLKFSWLFSIKFLIFNIDYYPYYFIIFACVLIIRRLSLNAQRTNLQSPFVVPHMWRFSDLQFNNHSGWFDRAWSEVKWEALQRLKELHAANAIEFEHEQLLSFDDIRRFKRKYKLKGRAGKFLELDEEEKGSEKIDFSKFDNLDPSNPALGKPIKLFNLKGWFSRLPTISFLPASVDSRISDDMQLSDTRKEQSFRRSKKFRGSTDVPLSSLKSGARPEDLSSLDPDVITKKFDLREKPAISFFWFRKQVELLLRGRITFSKFISDFRVGPQKYSDRNIFINHYDIDDFDDEFHRLFLDPLSEFNLFVAQDIAHRRMMPDDENIHFYRKPGSILQNEIMLQKFGTESDQLHYIIEFPGRFNRTYVNAFSKAYAIRNLNYNQPQYGFLSFPRNAKLPTTFEEFVVFCSKSDNKTDSTSNIPDLSMTEKPENVVLNPNLVRLRELWNLFQYVTKYEYNMLNEHSMEDTRLVRSLIEDRPFLFDNLKFWVNKAAVDAVHFNFLKPSFFSMNATVDDEELVMKGADTEDRLVNLDLYRGREDASAGTVSSLLSILYIFYIYLFLFVFFMIISLVFCFIFLFLYSILNYVEFLVSS